MLKSWSTASLSTIFIARPALLRLAQENPSTLSYGINLLPSSRYLNSVVTVLSPIIMLIGIVMLLQNPLVGILLVLSEWHHVLLGFRIDVLLGGTR